MNSRLSRPLLAAVISGALAGGLAAAPALADPSPPAVTEPTTAPATTEPTVEPPTVAPTTEPATTPPTTEPATTPPTTEPATTPPTTAPPTTATPTPPADKTAPTGAFSLNRWSIWTGQTVTITVFGVGDNVSVGPEIKRVVTWGDGSTQTLHHTAKNVTHTYKSSGKKPITLTLTDLAGNKKVAKSSGPTVSTPALKYKLNKTSVWPGQKFVWEITSVPAGTKKIAVNWGDGRSSVLAVKKQKVTRFYYTAPNGALVTPGAKTIKAVVSNSYGAAASISVGKVTVKKDSSRPVLRVTPPSKANKASSWKAIKGTATDTGSGIKAMEVITLVIKSNNTAVCYAPKSKKWLNANTGPAACLVSVKPVKGKFSIGLKGTPKGYLGVIGVAHDWAHNWNWQADSAEAFGIIYERQIS